jgi:hypothetical protein
MRLEEVSSVDRAANPKACVMLTKRWDGHGELGDRGYPYVQKESEPMREHNLVSVAKGLGNAVEKGLDGETFAKMQIELASQMYPYEPTPYHALAKLLDTNIGKSITAKAAQANYERLQKRNALGDAYDVPRKADTTQSTWTEPYDKD